MVLRSLPFYLVLCLFLHFSTNISAQAPEKPTSAEIYESIKKLNFLGSALYIAAHPDDENTALISYLANEMKANVAYLSLTRGDGGQNLIGPEIRELLGVIRTQELLAARSVDGGNQMFTRANDFGYSKHPDETLDIWNEEEVFSDVIWGIRKWQPDVIINRFDHRTPGESHGHHTTSAILSVDAFNKVNDPNVYPEQLQYVDTWQPKRLFYNTSWWAYGGREAFEKIDKSHLTALDLGVYYPSLGKSNNEISAESRSMHKCQGFGSVGSRGADMQYLELIKGDFPEGETNLFHGINTTWTRVQGGAPIGKILDRVQKEFQFDRPGASVPDLVEAYKLIRALPDGYWKRVKEKEIKEVIVQCMAFYLEVTADNYSATPGEEVMLSFEAVNRSEVPLKIASLSILPEQFDTTLNHSLDYNQVEKFEKKVMLPEDIAYTNPYWLNEEGTLGMYKVEDPLLRGLPETPRSFKVQFQLEVAGAPLVVEREVVFKQRDPVAGEVYRPFEIIPAVAANLNEKVVLFGSEGGKEVGVIVKAGKANIQGQVSLDLPVGWRAEPSEVDFELKFKGEEQRVVFQLFPPEEQSEGYLRPIVKVGDRTYDKEIVYIEYDHIPTQTVIQESKAKIVKINLQKAGNRIGYFMGAGDEVPASLEQLGYEVTLLEDRDMTVENLSRFDAVIMGVRAYNTQRRLRFHQDKLMEYVKRGGTMIVQYNTASRFVTGLAVPMEEIGPYPLKLSRDRVTDEYAEVRFLQPDHPVLNYPNKITQKDFEGWVQERGLYFPNEWDDAYQAILSSNDKGEPARNGGLLVAEYGEGYYVYTGYSWFRELPAGVAGAFRIFANMISLGKETRP
jgi:LmbE family N-acetylglucosaminyl deacetylase